MSGDSLVNLSGIGDFGYPFTNREIESNTSSPLEAAATSTELVAKTLGASHSEKLKKQTKYAKWSSPESNALMKALPQREKGYNRTLDAAHPSIAYMADQVKWDYTAIGHKLGFSAPIFFRLTSRSLSPAGRKMASSSTLCQPKKSRA